MVNFKPRPLYHQGKDTCYPVTPWIGGSGRGSEEKNSRPLPGLKPAIFQPRSPALYRAIMALRVNGNSPRKSVPTLQVDVFRVKWIWRQHHPPKRRYPTTAGW